MKEYGNLRKDVNMANLDNLMLELRCDSDMLKAVHVAMRKAQTGPTTTRTPCSAS